MSTPKKLLLFIGAPLVLLILVFFVIFPGLPAYAMVKLRYDSIDTSMESFGQYASPADFERTAVKGISVKVPAGFELSSTGSSLRDTSGEGTIGVLGTSATSIDPADYLEDYDPWENYRCGEKEYRKLFEKLGRDYIDPSASDNRFLWFIRDELRSKDCLALRGGALRAYMESAESKDISCGMEEAWKLTGSDFEAFVAHSTNPAFNNAEYWTVTIYPDSAPGSNYFMMLRNIPEETVKQIISSIQLAK